MNSDEHNGIEPISFKIGGRPFEAEVLTTAKGSFWWAFCGTDGNPSGREIEPFFEQLPTEVSVEGQTFEFGSVVLDNSDGTSTTKPFHKTRRVQAEINLQGVDVSIQCRVTRKRNKKWHLSFTGNLKRKNRYEKNSQTIKNRKENSEDEVELTVIKKESNI